MQLPIQKTSRVILLEAIALACVGYAYFNIGDAGIKILTQNLPFTEIIFIQSLMITLLIGGYGWWRHGAASLRTKKVKLVFLRALLIQVVTVCSVLSFAHVSLATFYSLIFTSPFWVVLLSAYFLKDKLDIKSGLVIAFGFLVVVGVFQPWQGEFNIWWLAVLAAALFYSCQLVITRALGEGENRYFLINSSGILSLLWTLPVMIGHFVMPTTYEWGLFVMMAVVGSIGLLCVIRAFQTAPSAALIAPYHYTQIIWGALLGYFIFNEVPSPLMMAGAGLIILAGLYLIFRGGRQQTVLPVTTEGVV